MVNLLERAFKGTVKDGSKKSDSFGTAFKWVAVALGLADSNLDEDRSVEPPQVRRGAPEQRDRHCRGGHGRRRIANAQIRITNRRRARQAANDAAIAAGRSPRRRPRAPRSGRVRPRRAAGDFAARTWSEFARTNDSRKVCVCARKECVLAPLAQLFLRN